MKNRKLIEMLAKLDWEADIKIGEENRHFEDGQVSNIFSISSFTEKDKPQIRINIKSKD